MKISLLKLLAFYDSEVTGSEIKKTNYIQLLVNILIHLVHLILFTYLDIKILIFYNIIILAFSLNLFSTIKYNLNKIFFFYIYFELILYSWLTAFLLGLDLGVQYLILILFTFSFVTNIKSKIATYILVIIQIANYIALRIALHYGLIYDNIIQNHKLTIESIGYLTLLIALLNIYRSVRIFKHQYVNSIGNLKFLIDFDDLTGLYTRSSFLEKANQEFQNYLHNKEQFVIVFADIDDFKKINDNYGHQAGDTVLKEVAKLFKENLRENDYIARWGGEEFVIMLTNTNLNQGRLVIEKLRQEIINDFITSENNHFKFTITFGIAKPNNISINSIIKEADIHMYQGKKSGKNLIIS